MGWITTGTVNLVNGSNVVTGVGSLFLEDARIGDGFRGPNGMLYEVTNIPTNTSLTIQPAYEGATVNAAPYFLVPIEGYVKESADRLRVATGQIALIPGTKQDKNGNLSALSALSGAADRMFYFTSDSAMALAPFTSKARLLLARADSAGMRSEISAAQSGANSDITSLAGLTTPLSVAQGGLGVTSLPIPFTRLRDSQALTYAEATAERLRMKTFEPINFVVDIDDASTSQVRGPGYVIHTTIGTKPPGFVYGILNTLMITGDVLSQTFEPLSGLSGVTFPLFRRTGYGATAGRWGPWRMVMDSDSAVNDPDTGGILRRTVVSGIALTKYADGRNIANGTFQAESISIPANSTQPIFIGLPFSIGPDDSFSTASINIQANIAHDHYGVVSAWLSSGGTTLTVIIRNGATAQTFFIRGILMGHWK